MGEQTSLAKITEETGKYLLAADQLSAVPSAFNPKQLQLLHQATPEEHIHVFPNNAGKLAGLKFVTGGYMKHMLDRLTGSMWSFEIKEKGVVESANQIWVLGRLTLYKQDGSLLLFKEQFGRALIKRPKNEAKGFVDLGNDMKAAATDAFKKCASEVGIARDIYAPHEFLEADIVDRDDITDLKEQDDAAHAEANPNNATNTKTPEKVDQEFKNMVNQLLLDMYPKTTERLRYIKEATKKISLQALNDWDWRYLYEDLKNKSLSQLNGEEDVTDEAE